MNLALLVALAAVVVLVVSGLVVVLAVVMSGRRRLRRELASARADLDALRSRLDGLTPQAQPTHEPPSPTSHEYLITSLAGDEVPGATLAVPDTRVPPVSAGQFVSAALGESLVRLLSLGYGVSRALSAESRNRIRFEVRREVKRSRKQRRRDLKEAKRQLRTGDRGDLAEDAA